MKNVCFLLALLFTLPTFAADLVVEEFGVAPAYSSIQAAINAANAGDRILIKNRTAGIPWLENLTLNKNIELLSYENDSSFTMQGNISMVPTNGITITIVGMVNLTGNINHSTSSGTARGTTVNIIDSEINGFINLDAAPFVVNLIGNTIANGYTYLNHGSIIGNDFQQNNVIVYESGTYSAEEFRIIGNRFVHTGTPLIVECSHYNFQIRNNFVHSTSGGDGISISRGNNSSLIHNIYNNTVKLEGSSSSYYAIQIGSWATSPWLAVVEIMNNVLDGNNNTYSRGISIPTSYISGNVNIYFNFIDGNFSSAIVGSPTLDFNNNKTSNFTIPTTGILPAGHPGINGGNPAPPFYNLDLSVGDAGCFGGSFTLDNFFPLHTGAARVYMVNYPFNVRQGSTLSIDADSYDR